MSVEVPVSTLSTEHLEMLSGFDRNVANALDEALATGGGAGDGASVDVTNVAYGATGDGVTDDRAAIQLAIEAAITGGLGVYFPAGTYKLGRYLFVDGARNLRIHGGAGAVIRFPSDDESVVADAYALSNQHARSAFYLRNCSDVEISDLTFKGGDAPNISTTNLGNAVSARYCVGTVVRRCTARGGYALFNQDAQGDLSGTGDSIAVASGTVTLTDAAALFLTGHIARRITIAGCTNPANNGTFQILTRPSTSPITWTNADAVAETSSFTWSIDCGDRGTHIVDCRSENQRGLITTGNDAVIRNCTFERPTNTMDVCGVGDEFTVNGTTVTLTDKAGRFLPSHHGKLVKIASATSGANNGTFAITYVSSTQISWTNAAGVAEFFNGTWWVANGERVGLGGGTAALSLSGAIVTVTVAAPAFTANDIYKTIRIQGAPTTSNNGAYAIASVISPTQITINNSAGASEDWSGIWSLDSYDRASLTGNTVGSTHGVYIFAGRSNILVDGCTFKGIRTTCVKVSGSSLPVRNIRVRNCYAVDCGNFYTGGADDIQEHTDLVIEGNTIIDCGTNSPGRSESVAINVLGARALKIRDNLIYYTRDGLGTVDGRTIAGSYAISLASAAIGGAQPLEDVVIEGNRILANPDACTYANVVNTAILCSYVGVKGKWGQAGTLTKSGNTMTLTDASIGFSAQDIGKNLDLQGAPNAGNNGSGFTVSAVPSSTSVQFVNAAGVGGGVSAGTWRLRSSLNGPSTLAYPGAGCRIVRNDIQVPGVVAIYSRFNVGPVITDNTLAAGTIYTDGDVFPHIERNRLMGANTQTAKVRIFDGTSWPIIGQNTIGLPVWFGASDGYGFTVGDSSGSIWDWPLLGHSGLAVPTEGKEQVVMAYGSLHVDGDTIQVGANTFTYKASAPGANEFNSCAGLIALIDALADYTCTDYGAPWGITTSHLLIASNVVGTTAGLFVVQQNVTYPTALVLLMNNGSYWVKSRGAASAGPTADKTVVWSPLCSYQGNVLLNANNAAARTLLTAGGQMPVKNYKDSGACEVIQHNADAGTEEFRWAIL